MNINHIISTDQPVRFHFLRLRKGDDIMNSIRAIAAEKQIAAGTVISSVGCTYEAKIRAAGGKNIIHIQEPCEILSINGTVSQDRCHLHIALSKEDLSTIGGHLCPGCYVNTTCELIICEFLNVQMIGEFDPNTGYSEIVISDKKTAKC